MLLFVLSLTHVRLLLLRSSHLSSHAAQRFNPKFSNLEMRSRLSDGHPQDPVIIYVGRLGAEKRLRDLKGVLERCVWCRHRNNTSGVFLPSSSSVVPGFD